MENIKRADYEWMIKPTPQSEWIEKNGIFLMLAFFLSEIGAGIYFLSMIFGLKGGMIFGWLLTLVLGGGVHMYYLGNPLRFWRIFLKPKTSELSRGVWVIAVFAALGFLQIVESSAFNAIYIKSIMGIVCILLIMHGFATMNTIKAIPFWNSSIVLPLSIISGLWVGYQIVEILLLKNGVLVSFGIAKLSLIMLLTYTVCLIMYFWSASHSSEIASISIKDMLCGSSSKFFYTFILGIGILLPALITVYSPTSSVLLVIRLLAVFIGDLALRYILMKNAYYKPLI
ncbi:MAG: DMSO reductase [Deltaproteobacteria bacterium]|nr:DMSO reductase [Deltaproteobacteria bacterium]